MKDTAAPGEPPVVVLIVGLFVIVAGAYAVVLATATGWLVALVLGAVHLAIAVLVPTSRSARSLRLILGGFGVVALLGAVIGMF
jgi:hypothetical protein